MPSSLAMDIRKLVGTNVRRIRKAAKLSREAIGVRMGVDRAHVGLIERGEQNATLLTIWSLCEALDVVRQRFSMKPRSVETRSSRPVELKARRLRVAA